MSSTVVDDLRRDSGCAAVHTLLPDGAGPVTTKVTVFLEVEGAAHYLPAYAGNLDIMTSTALRAGESLARRLPAQVRDDCHREGPPALLPGRDVAGRHARRPAPHPPADVGRIVTALDGAGADAIEVAHGDGLADGSLNNGPGSNTDWEWIEAAAENLERTVLTTLLQPGIGTIASSSTPTRSACARCGSRRTATRPTSPRSTSRPPATSAWTSPVPDDDPHGAGLRARPPRRAHGVLRAHCVYVTDCGGRLTMDGVRERVRAHRDVLRPDTQIGIHAHQNLSLAVAKSVVAVEEA